MDVRTSPPARAWSPGHDNTGAYPGNRDAYPGNRGTDPGSRGAYSGNNGAWHRIGQPPNRVSPAMVLTFIGAAVLLSVIMSGAWALARATGNSGWVDVVWSFGLGVAGLVLALVPGFTTPSARQIVVAVLIAAWSLRLGLHIAQRSLRGPEDARYAALRQEWGASFASRLFWFLQIQAAAAALLGLSMLLAAHNPAPWPRLLDVAGIAVMVVAVTGEAIADEQLRRFKANPANRGQVCDTGMWSWSRHPNYFFEWFGWIAYALLAIDLSGGWYWGWLALSGPAFMYFLLVHISGIPLTEQQMLKSRGAVFARYQARVSALFPLPPKDDAP